MPDLMPCVAIFGGPGSGKRSVAEALAQRLSWAFVDFDAEIAGRRGEAVPHLVDSLSDESVQRLTVSLVEELLTSEPTVVAFDGRWPGNPIAMDMLSTSALTVWLSASPSEAVRRMRASGRPHRLLEHSSPVDAVAGVLQTRQSLPERVDLKIATDGRGVEEVAFEIEQLVRFRKHSQPGR